MISQVDDLKTATHSLLAPGTMAPDWASFSAEIHCPLCGYNLRGLVEATCPECGGRFQWNDLLDPRRRSHEFLFEYHPEANVQSLLGTLGAGVRPIRFWRSVHPVLPIRMNRLRLYLSVIFGVMFASFVVGQVAISIWKVGMGWWGPQFRGNPLLPWTWSTNDVETLLMVNSHFVNFTIWFVATFSALLIFQGTMRRARIRPGHLLRCMTYSSDVFIWYAAGLGLLDLWEAFAFDDPAVVTQYVVFLVVVGMVVIRLIVAFRAYLQFPHPIATVLATQVIAVLVIANLYLAMVWL